MTECDPVSIGSGTAAFIELFTTEDANLISVEPRNVEGLLEEYPFYEIVEIPAGTYEGEDEAVTAVGDPAILFTSADADEETIRNITARCSTTSMPWDKSTRPPAR